MIASLSLRGCVLSVMPIMSECSCSAHFKNLLMRSFLIHPII
ncbi:hypothetical protein Q648_00869 [Bartonella quintana JK 12]|uniref:Uncharacterized protein n=2 Tax=Bartonella quintana TaxID=803 RepID=W3U1I6_BARQI|nr:hypothetical protein Q651_00904 [Bartonella quintana BQ2-D70]ETS15140.1 hypothetical protein Q650_00012 [Bartonella quintana JK 73rel]ETS17432.1 hypothetical protein Q649_00012 [Bartonella quintana JK 73]ETS17467.1 hypothetical protein Q648_00869 [Bartonella quintana JK 12]ETS19525.1 hypothetical protein Q647_00012 [Bartonella quintana JK 7]KEC58146.1 hypothetical protein O93_01225 [Bartonella quintana JK 19]KEC61041.1 hypothetical protein O91_00880 [Bartonella quintana JK 31]KEC64280.1 h